jgi:CRP-like cAMP-binding protein
VQCCDGDGIIGTLTPDQFAVLKMVAKPIFESFHYNFAEELIHSACDSVSLFSDMSDKDRATLATKVDVVTFSPGSSVYKQGSVGKSFFVVVQGAIEELVEQHNEETGVVTCEPGPVYLPGQFFGEQALVTQTCYPSTMTCIETCVLLSINQDAYRSVFVGKQRISEIEIKLAGERVELKYIIMHPQGFLLFSEFVNKERSAENLNFYIHCEHFEEMCKLIKKKSRKHGAYSSNHSHHNRHSSNRHTSSRASHRQNAHEHFVPVSSSPFANVNHRKHVQNVLTMPSARAPEQPSTQGGADAKKQPLFQIPDVSNPSLSSGGGDNSCVNVGEVTTTASGIEVDMATPGNNGNSANNSLTKNEPRSFNTSSFNTSCDSSESLLRSPIVNLKGLAAAMNEDALSEQQGGHHHHHHKHKILLAPVLPPHRTLHPQGSQEETSSHSGHSPGSKPMTLGVQGNAVAPTAIEDGKTDDEGNESKSALTASNAGTGAGTGSRTGRTVTMLLKAPSTDTVTLTNPQTPRTVDNFSLHGPVVSPSVMMSPYSRKTEHWKSTSIKYFKQQSMKMSTISAENETTNEVPISARQRANTCTAQSTPLEALFTGGYRTKPVPATTDLHSTGNSRVKSYQVAADLGDVKAAGLSVGMALSGAAAGTTAGAGAGIAGTAVASGLPPMNEDGAYSEATDPSDCAQFHLLGRLISEESQVSNTTSIVGDLTTATAMSASTIANSAKEPPGQHQYIHQYQPLHKVNSQQSGSTHQFNSPSTPITPLTATPERAQGSGPGATGTTATTDSAATVGTATVTGSTQGLATSTLNSVGIHSHFDLGAAESEAVTEKMLDSVRVPKRPVVQPIALTASMDEAANHSAHVTSLHAHAGHALIKGGSMNMDGGIDIDDRTGLQKANRGQHIPATHLERVISFQTHYHHNFAMSTGDNGTNSNNNSIVVSTSVTVNNTVTGVNNSASSELDGVMVLNSNLKGIRDYLQTIIDKHVKEGAAEEVNLPGTLRAKLCKSFADWCEACAPLISGVTSFGLKSTEEVPLATIVFCY